MNVRQHKHFFSILSSILAFAISLLSAIFFEWTLREIIWGIWVVGFFVGLMSMLNVVIGEAINALYSTPLLGTWRQKLTTFFKESIIFVFSMSVLITLVLLFMFFPLYFSFTPIFEIISQIYPIEGLDSDFMKYLLYNRLSFLKILHADFIKPYFLLIVAAVINEHKSLIHPIIKTIKGLTEKIRSYKKGNYRLIHNTAYDFLNQKKAFWNALIIVLKLVAAIFFIVLAGHYQFPSLLVFLIVFSFLFFPYEIFHKQKTNRELDIAQRYRDRNFK